MKNIFLLFLLSVFINLKAQNANYEAAKVFFEQQKDYKNAKIEIDKVTKDSDSTIELKNNYLRLRIYAALLKEYSLQSNFELNEFINQLNYAYQLAEKSKNRIGFNYILQNIAQVHLNKIYEYLKANKLTETQKLLTIAETAYIWHEYDKTPTSKYLMNAFDHYFVFYKSWMFYKNNDFKNAKNIIETVSFSEFLKKDAEYFDYLIELYTKAMPEKLNYIYLEATTYQPKFIKYFILYFDHEIAKGNCKSSIFNVIKKESLKNFPDSIIIYEKIANCYKDLDILDMDYSILLNKYFEDLHTATQKFPNHNGFKYQRMLTFMNILQLQYNSMQKNKNNEELKEAYEFRLSKAKEYYTTLKIDSVFIKSLTKEEKDNFNSFQNNLN